MTDEKRKPSFDGIELEGSSVDSCETAITEMAGKQKALEGEQTRCK
jgi:hypothetical protein